MIIRIKSVAWQVFSCAVSHENMVVCADHSFKHRSRIVFLKYKLVKSRLLERRDRFIAEQITKTLLEGGLVPRSLPGEGGTGILLIGAYHVIRSKLPADIQVNA